MTQHPQNTRHDGITARTNLQSTTQPRHVLSQPATIVHLPVLSSTLPDDETAQTPMEVATNE